MRLTDLIPHSDDGASRFGVHFLKDLACPYEFALKWVLPTQDGRGITPAKRTAGALDVGLAFHKFAEVWYLSRCATGADNGVPNLEEALAAADKLLVEAEVEWADDDVRDIARADVRAWGLRYHEQWGPGGAQPEFPHTAVYVDDSGPWVERTLEVPMGGGLTFTCRIDLVATHLGALGPWDHKTVAPSRYWALVQGLDLDAQPTGNLLALRHHLPELAPQLTFWVANLLNKAGPAKSKYRGKGEPPPPLGRERTHRTTADLDAFATMVRRLLVRLDEQVGEWGAMVEVGVEPIVALARVFPRFGQLSGHCRRYNRDCDYAPLCGAVGYEPTVLGNYRTRIAPPPTATEED